MYKEIAEITVSKSTDCDKMFKALEKDGFLLILAEETTTDRFYYVVVKSEVKE